MKREKKTEGKRGLPRIGQIDFSNCLPINLPIKKGAVVLEGEFISRVPSGLNALIEAGDLDVSAVSLYCYLNCPSLSLVPGISVSSLGPVGSVLFFYQGDIKDLDNAPILVPNASATSINLLRVILDQEASVKADFQTVLTPDLPGSSASGALIIGDEALKVDKSWSASYNRIDLGKWWYDRFKLPMVFGVWAARSEFVEQEPVRYKAIEEALIRSRDLGLSSHLEEVVDAAACHMVLDRERVRRYFIEELDYNLGDEHRKSIELFAKLCGSLN